MLNHWQTLVTRGVVPAGIVASATLLAILVGQSLSPPRLGANSAIGASAREAFAVAFDPPEVDFGEVQTGSKALTTVRLVNRGAEPVRIVDVVSTCGCTVAEAPRDPIAPGDEVEVTVRMSVPGKAGTAANKAIRFLFDGRTERVTLPVRATARDFIESRPARLPIAHVPERVITLMAADGEAFAITGLNARCVESDADLRRRAVAHTVTLPPDAADLVPGGRVPRELIVTTDHPRAGTVTIPLTPVRNAKGVVLPKRGEPHDAPSEPLGASDDLQVFPMRVSVGDLPSAEMGALPGITLFLRGETLDDGAGFAVRIDDSRLAVSIAAVRAVEQGVELHVAVGVASAAGSADAEAGADPGAGPGAIRGRLEVARGERRGFVTVYGALLGR